MVQTLWLRNRSIKLAEPSACCVLLLPLYWVGWKLFFGLCVGLRHVMEFFLKVCGAIVVGLPEESVSGKPDADSQAFLKPFETNNEASVSADTQCLKF